MLTLAILAFTTITEARDRARTGRTNCFPAQRELTRDGSGFDGTAVEIQYYPRKLQSSGVLPQPYYKYKAMNA